MLSSSREDSERLSSLDEELDSFSCRLNKNNVIRSNLSVRIVTRKPTFSQAVTRLLGKVNEARQSVS